MRIILWAIALMTVSATAQKSISLEDAVMQQGRLFRADRMMAFQWIPNTQSFTYLADSGKKLMTASVTNTTGAEMVSLAEVNNATGGQFRNFGTLKWMDATTFMMADGGKYYTFDTKTKSGKKLVELPTDAENAEFDDANANLAFTQKNNLYVMVGGQQKAVTNEADENIVSGQSIARNEFGIHDGIFWAPGGKRLAFYQKDQRQVADYPMLDINETPGKLVSIKYPMIGQTSESPRVGIYDVASGRTVFITPRKNADDYLTNLSWTPDGNFVLIAELNRGQNDMNLNLYDARTGNFVRTLVTETASTWVEPEHAAFFPSKTSNNFVWVSEKDGYNNLYYYSIDGKLIRQLTRNTFVLKDIVGANPTGNEIFFTATGTSPLNLQLFKVDLKGRQTLLTPADGYHNAQVSTDGKWIFDEYSSRSVPSKSQLIGGGKTKILLESANKYDGYTLGTSEVKTIKAADGKTDLYTRLIKPSNFDPAKKYPVFVYVYGGPHAQMITNTWMDGANLWMYWMAEQGYLVFTVDNRGSDSRGAAFEKVIHRNLGEAEMADQLKGVEYLKSLPYVDGNRLSVHGWSYGGFMTTSLMLRHPDVFKVAVAGGPVIDWKWYEVMYGERYMDTPAENKEGFERSTVSNYAKNLKGKMLLIHGTADDVVVEQHNLSLVKKMVEAGKHVDYFPYPMHKHNVIGKDRVHLIEKVLQYVIDNNQ